MGGLSGWPLVFQRLVTALVFTLLRVIYTNIQKVYWRLSGTASKIRDSRRPENYGQCAQLLDIVLFYKFDYAYNGSIKDYVLSHNRFESPQFIVDNDHVSLITVNEENAIFGVAEQKDMHLRKFEYCSFMPPVTQVFHFSQLILVPLNHFHRMAEELGDPKGQLIFLFSTGRCGSTLLSQMMQATGQCIAISGPDSTSAVALRYKKQGDSPELRQLTRDVVRWTCRPYKNIYPSAHMVKIMPYCTYALPIFREVFPNSKCIFMYRNVVKVAQSIHRVSRKSPTLVLTCKLGRLSPILSERCFDYFGYLGKELRYKFLEDLSLGAMIATVNCKAYLEFRRNGFDVSGVRYEDILKEKNFAARAILEFCGLPLSLEQEFLQGLEFDSQRNSGVSQKMLAKDKEPPLKPDSEALANEVLKRNGLPIIGDDWLLEGTITYNKGTTACKG